MMCLSWQIKTPDDLPGVCFCLLIHLLIMQIDFLVIKIKYLLDCVVALVWNSTRSHLLQWALSLVKGLGMPGIFCILTIKNRPGWGDR
jgi:hypothetical protein